MTKAKDFISSKKTGKNDIFRITRVKDLASIEKDAESFISKNSAKYGKTKEFSLWSHSGLDGPIGTVATSSKQLSQFEPKQMSLEGWGVLILTGTRCKSLFLWMPNRYWPKWRKTSI